jgi:hypothetical protein
MARSTWWQCRKTGSGNYHQRLHALDLALGTELFGGPGGDSGDLSRNRRQQQRHNVVFDPGQYKERAALLLLNGVIYTGWASHCDIRPYTGWIMGYSESTLAQTSVLNVTPNGNEGAIWMAGAGLAADTSGNIYFLDANGDFDTNMNASGFPSDGDYGNAFMKLSTFKRPRGGRLLRNGQRGLGERQRHRPGLRRNDRAA